MAQLSEVQAYWECTICVVQKVITHFCPTLTLHRSTRTCQFCYHHWQSDMHHALAREKTMRVRKIIGNLAILHRLSSLVCISNLKKLCK